MHSKTDELILKTAKEIIAKFIETRTVTPHTFSENFRNVYDTVEKTVRGKVKQGASENGKS